MRAALRRSTRRSGQPRRCRASTGLTSNHGGDRWSRLRVVYHTKIKARWRSAVTQQDRLFDCSDTGRYRHGYVGTHLKCRIAPTQTTPQTTVGQREGTSGACHQGRSLSCGPSSRASRRSEGDRCALASAEVRLKMESDMIVGYARVSTDGQTLDAQQSALAGAEKVFAGVGGGHRQEGPRTRYSGRNHFTCA